LGSGEPHNVAVAAAREVAQGGRLLAALADLIGEAGLRIVDLASAGVRGRQKPDASLVSEADDAAEAMLVRGIQRILPGVPIVAEEAVARGERTEAADVYFLLDPLDGTREFLAGRPEFTINLAMVGGGVPTLGLVYAPMEAALFVGADNRAFRISLAPGDRFDLAGAAPIRARPRPGRLVAAVSRSHLDAETEAFLGSLPIAERRQLGSARKFCLIAEGAADVYPRLGPVREWDAAAGQALVAAAGGSMAAPDGSPLLYGRAENAWRVNGFVAWGAPPEG
jgi:3'(2'), 5'-bisphosphate nucleotidase